MSCIAPRFTPSLLDGDALECLFVNREDILNASVDNIFDAAASGRLNHKLYIGPRGSGKTHLVSLIVHRAKKLEEYGNRFVISWLNENAYLTGVFDFATLMESIQKNIEPKNDNIISSHQLVVVFIENFDRILKNLHEEGQRELRALIEQNENILLITTSTRLTGYIVQQASPFYGFFDITELQPFNAAEAAGMLQHIARLNGNHALEKRLGEPEIKTRLSAIACFAGGQPRVWAFLAAGLTIENINDLTNLFIRSLDDLAPYYEEQLGSLSSNERKIVLALVQSNKSLTVKDMAMQTGISERSLSKTLNGINPQWAIPRKGYLQQFIDKRNVYYQLSEPLARIVLQIKEFRGNPLKNAVDFLQEWFVRFDLGCMATDDPKIVAECGKIEYALADMQKQKTSKALLELSIELVDLIEEQLVTISPGLLRIDNALFAIRHGGGKDWLRFALDSLNGINPDEKRNAYLMIAGIRFFLGEKEAAFITLDNALAQSNEEFTSVECSTLMLIISDDTSLQPGDKIDLLENIIPFISDGDDFLYALDCIMEYMLPVVSTKERKTDDGL